LTERHPIKPTSPRCHSAWQLNLGRHSTYRRGKSVQTTGTTSHVVSADQPFAPLIKGPPDFREIANRPNVTVASLRRTIAALPLVPRKGGMANPHLTDDQLADVAAYIMTLREHRANQ